MRNTVVTFIISLLLLSCREQTQNLDPIPTHETVQIPSAEIGETRIINIWTPPGYKEGVDSLPVLYMLDGGIKEDFPHIANTLDTLIKSNKIPSIILVGIENTERRRDLTGPTEVAKDKEIATVVGQSEKFSNFVRNELIPEINKKYKTTNQKGIIGESLAGLFVTETLLLHPDMFDFYIAFDPSIWWNDTYLLKTADQHLTNFPTTNKRFWFAGSDAEDINVHTDSLAKTLQTKKLPNLRWQYADEPNEQHNTIFRATKEKALIWTLNP